MDQKLFNQTINRRHTNCLKWDTNPSDDILPMWVADMDFAIAPEIHQAMQNRLDHPVFGYTFPGDQCDQAIVDWVQRHYHWIIHTDDLCYTPGVVPTLTMSILALTQPGDDVIIMSPVYHPFHHIIQNSGRHLVICPLVRDSRNYYQIDFDNLEACLTDRSRMILFCNPHNPVGRVWQKSELEKLAEFCLKHKLLVVSDEIHADFIFSGHKHIPFASISPEIASQTITAYAPSKTFNIAGLNQSYAVIPNPELRKRFMAVYDTLDLGNNIFGLTALLAAYTQGDAWLKELLKTLEANRDFAVNYIQSEVPQIKVFSPEGTFLLWLDCDKLGLRYDALYEFFMAQGKIRMNPGYRFGDEANMFMRFNIGCPLNQVKDGLTRIKRAVDTLS